MGARRARPPHEQHQRRDEVEHRQLDLGEPGDPGFAHEAHDDRAD